MLVIIIIENVVYAFVPMETKPFMGSSAFLLVLYIYSNVWEIHNLVGSRSWAAESLYELVRDIKSKRERVHHSLIRQL